MTQTMEHSTALAHSGNGAGTARANPSVGQRGIVVNTIDELWRLSQAFAKSGLAPKGISSPEAIFTAVQLGLELGLSPMSALQSIAVVNGRPSIYGDAALALVRGSGICDFYTEFPSNDEIHSLAEQLAIALEYGEIDEVKRLRREIASKSTKMRRDAEDFGYTSISKRAGGINAVIRRFTIGDAKKAQLLGKSGPWVQYQERMLMWRSRGFNLRDNFGDILRGMYTAEEAADIPVNGGTTVVSAMPGESRTEALLAKVTRKPVSEGQTFEPTPEAAAQAEAEISQQASEPTQTVETAEPDVSSVVDAGPPETTGPDFTDYDGFRLAMIDLAIEKQISEADMGKMISAAVLGKGMKGKEQQIGVEVLRRWYQDFADGKGFFAKKD